ncbi:hypothetical protein ABPG75_004160 [Micractinium tetrahymenae]
MCISSYLLKKAGVVGPGSRDGGAVGAEHVTNGKAAAASAAAMTAAPPPAEMSAAAPGKQAGTVGLRPYHVVEVTSPISTFLRYLRCFSILCGTPEYRHARTLQLTFDIAASLVIVGATFLGLCLAGVFPASIEVQKYVGTYAENIAKYSMYLWTGLVGVTAPLVAGHALRRDRSLVPALALFYLANASVVVCLSLSIYLLTKGAQMGMEWWMYLISALMIIQRCLYFVSAGVSCYSLHRAMSDERVRAVMAGEVAPDQPVDVVAAGAGAKLDPVKGAMAMV